MTMTMMMTMIQCLKTHEYLLGSYFEKKRQLPDGVRTDGVATEVPQFPHCQLSWESVVPNSGVQGCGV